MGRLVIVMTIVFDLITFAGIFVAIGHDSNGTIECTSGNGLCPPSVVPHGVWKNFPQATTCGSANFTAFACELMGNTTYRRVAVFTSTQASVNLEVGCVTPSSVVGETLQLQYANYSSTTRTNVTNYVNLLGATVFDDNSANYPCPGNLASSYAALPAGVTAFVFRVIGYNGGLVSGDNPRFSSIAANLVTTVVRVPAFIPTSITTTGFTANIRFSYPLSAALTVTFQWIATSNGVLVQSGSGSCSAASGSVGCNSAITFGSAFATTPNVTGSGTNPTATITVPIMSLTMLSTQTVTA